jgi:hypothetical protein
MNLFLFVVPSTEASVEELRVHWFPQSSGLGQVVSMRDAIASPELEPFIGTVDGRTLLISSSVVDGLCIHVGGGGVVERRWKNLWCFVRVGDGVSRGDYRHQFVRMVRGVVVRSCDWGSDRAPLANGPILEEERTILDKAKGAIGLTDFWADYSRAPTLAAKRQKERRAQLKRLRAEEQSYARSKMKSVANKGRSISSVSSELKSALAPFEKLFGNRGVLEDFVRENPRLSEDATLASIDGDVSESRPVDVRQNQVATVLLRGLISEALGKDCDSEKFLSLKLQRVEGVEL